MNSFESPVEIEMLCKLYSERLRNGDGQKYYDYNGERYSYNDKFGYKIVNSSHKIKKLFRKK